MPFLVPPVLPAGRMSSRPQPLLRSAGVVIRPWGREDVEALMAAYADVTIQRWHARTVTSPGEAFELIDKWNRGWATESAARWAVVDDRVGEVLGQVGLCSIDRQEGEAGVSYWVMPQAREGGVATESVRVVTQWAFDDLGLGRLELHHSVMNVASCRVAVKADFVLEGTMHQKAVHVDGRHDMHLHARLRDARALRRVPAERRSATG